LRNVEHAQRESDVPTRGTDHHICDALGVLKEWQRQLRGDLANYVE
jgi:hypothetical protein